MEKISQELFTVNNLWMMMATALVFIMNLGFATLESGLSRSKNTTSILFKNTIIPAFALLSFALWGFNLMFPGADFAGQIVGFSGFGIEAPAGDAGLINYAGGRYSYWTNFLFQALFASTAATIVSGAVVERIKLNGFMFFTILFLGFIYPVVGMWKWGGGWLNTMHVPFYDFAGSTIVHSTGGWAALAGALVLGPRIGKFVNGKIYPIPGHNMPLAVIGIFLLWLGWFGFTGGSVMNADPGKVSLVLVVTSLAAAAGGVCAMISSYFITKKHDLSMVLNGILGGLVGITAGADQMSPLDAIIVGLICGMLVVFSVLIFDRLKIDDPVGVTSVHLVCGIFGTLAVGLFGNLKGTEQIVAQLKGIVSVGSFVFLSSFVFFFTIHKVIGLRVSVNEELLGLDISENGMKAYEIDNIL